MQVGSLCRHYPRRRVAVKSEAADDGKRGELGERPFRVGVVEQDANSRVEFILDDVLDAPIARVREPPCCSIERGL